MSGNQQSKNIFENALKINKTIDPFLKEIEGLLNAANVTNPFNPLSIIELLKISRSREETRSEYYAKLNLCHNALNAEANGQGAEITQLHIISKGLIAISRLQDAWGSLEATLDRKMSLCVALLAIYISVLALFVSIIPFLWKVVDP